MEHQTVTQHEFPQLAIVLLNRALYHLRLRPERGVLAIERVEHHEPVIACPVGRCPNGIEDRKVRIRDEL